MSDRPKEGAGPESSAKTNQGKNKKPNKSNRNKKKNARQQEAKEAKEQAKVVPQTQDVKSNTSEPGNSAKDKEKSKVVPKSQDIKDHTSELGNSSQAKEIQKEMDEESIENNTIAFDTASSNGGTSQQESQNNSSEFYSATEDDVTLTEPGNVDDIVETRKEEDLEINKNNLINSDSLNEKHEEIEECEQNQTIESSPVLSKGPQEKVNLEKDASEEFNLNQGKEEFDSQKETEGETNPEKDNEIEKLQKGTVTQEEINLENGTHNKSNIEKASHEKTNIEPEAKEDFEPETEKQKDSKLETQKPEESTLENGTQEEPTLEKETQEEPTLEKDTQEESSLEKDTQEESTLEKDTQEESTLEKDTQEESTLEKDTQEQPILEQGAQEEPTLEQGTQEEPIPEQCAQEEPTQEKCTQLEPCLENGTQEEINHENGAHDESNNKKGSHDEDSIETETQNVSMHEKGIQESNEIEIKCEDEDSTHTSTDLIGYKKPSDDESLQPLTSPEHSGDTSKDIGNSSKNSCQPKTKSKRKNKSGNKSKSKKTKMTPSEGNDYDTSQKKDTDISSPTSTDKSALDANGIVKLNIDRSRIIGRNRGIDGANNSCYMDATLFSLFYCTDIFDETLLTENSCKGRQTSFNRKVLTILKGSIVYSLRQGYFCPRKNTWELRQAMQSLCPKICGSFMDAEEFIFLLFEKSLNVHEFIYYTAGTSDFMHQIFVEKENKDFATVQELFEKSMKNCDDLKLQSMPKPALILEMPRSNRLLIHHKGIVPSLRLDLTNVMVECALDSSQATSENSHTNVAGTSSAVIKLEQPSLINKQSSPGWFGFNWIKRLARKSFNMFFNCPRKFIGNVFYYFFLYTPIFLYYALWRPDNALRHFDSASADTSNTNSSLTSGQNDVESCTEEPDKKGSLSPQNIMDLIAIICIRGCHYTSFVKCDGNADAPLPTWLFFDSMSGGGPEVEEISDFEKWMRRLENEPENIPQLWEEMPWGVQRAIVDSHICIYKPSIPNVTVETTKEK